MIKKIITAITISAFLLTPALVSALEMPKSGNDLAAVWGINAQAYVVTDVNTGQVLISKNADMAWTPASLTKLMTLLVVLDTKPKLTKVVTMTKEDQVAGWCSQGGACIRSAAGVRFTVDGLVHAALMPSANNAANALARSTGLSTESFAQRMNEKAAALGATHVHFNEPTGLDPTNRITAEDYAIILSAAYANKYLRGISGLSRYTLKSINNAKYTQTIKNTNKLLTDSEVQIAMAKTGYLEESNYNFASVLKYKSGDEVAVVVLGEQHLYSAFAETKILANLGQQAKALAFLNAAILGTSTPALLTSN